MTSYWLDHWGSIPDRDRDFLLATECRTALRHTSPPKQREPGVFSGGKLAEA
jgi:hypothetical protein